MESGEMLPLRLNYSHISMKTKQIVSQDNYLRRSVGEFVAH
jgi:hypothetical protein